MPAAPGAGFTWDRHRHEDPARCREWLVGGSAAEPEPEETVKIPEGTDSITPARACPHCGTGRMVVIAEFPWMTSGVEVIMEAAQGAFAIHQIRGVPYSIECGAMTCGSFVRDHSRARV